MDTEPRNVTVPADFTKMLSQNAKARHHFDGLSYSKKKAFVQGIEGLPNGISSIGPFSTTEQICTKAALARLRVAMFGK